MVYLTEFDEIEQRWKDAGSPRCEHKRTALERMESDGLHSGDRGCLDCGERWWHTQSTPEPRGVEQAEPNP